MSLWHKSNKMPTNQSTVSRLIRTNETGPLCYRSVQAATRYAYDLASLLTAVSSLRLETLEVSQPAVTPDLLLLRLFYRDFLHTFPSLKAHDLVWRCVQGKALIYTLYACLQCPEMQCNEGYHYHHLKKKKGSSQPGGRGSNGIFH